MLSRVTNAVLMLAVIAMAIALFRAHDQADEPRVGESSTVLSDLPAGDASEEAALLAAAMAPFETVSFNPEQSADSHRERNPSRGSDGGSAGARGDRSWSGRGMPALTEELAQRCIEVAQEVDPELAQRLSDARTKNPQEFESQMRAGGFGRRLLSLAQLKTHDPRLYNDKIAELTLAVQIDRVAGQVREIRRNADASLSEVENLEGKLRALLQVQVALSIKARGEMLCRFEERAKELQTELDREARNFQTTVDARMAAITADGAQQPKADEAAPDAAPAPAGGV